MNRGQMQPPWNLKRLPWTAAIYERVQKLLPVVGACSYGKFNRFGVRGARQSLPQLRVVPQPPHCSHKFITSVANQQTVNTISHKFCHAWRTVQADRHNAASHSL